MSSLQELSIRQITEAAVAAVGRHIPITISIRVDQNWTTLQSRVLELKDNHLLLEIPPMEIGIPPHEFVPGEKLGFSFKLKHHKHIFTASVAGFAPVTLESGATINTVSICLPTGMQRLQRRAFFRAPVPANRIVRAAFWLGGCEAEPKGTSPLMPVWSGRVTNLSAGGFQLIGPMEATSFLEVGDTAGVRLSFGVSSGETVYADAQFRHLLAQDHQAVMGFQFVGLAYTNKGRDALKIISLKVSEFQQLAHEQSNAED